MRRNYQFFLLPLLVAVMALLPLQVSAVELRGDINGDGTIDSFDLITINKYLAQKTEFNELQMESADLLKDGIVNSDDAEVLKMYLLGECDTLPMTFDMLLKIYKERK